MPLRSTPGERLSAGHHKGSLRIRAAKVQLFHQRMVLRHHESEPGRWPRGLEWCLERARPGLCELGHGEAAGWTLDSLGRGRDALSFNILELELRK